MSSFTYIHVDLNPTIGVLQIGSLIGVFLFGVVSVQTYNYYAMYKEDGWVNKALVWLHLMSGHIALADFSIRLLLFGTYLWQHIRR